jgi:hypothetical protein
MNHEAVYALYPNVVSINDTTPFDAEGNEVTIDRAAVDAWVSPDQYKRDRVTEYPSIGDQLDALWKGGDDAAAMLEQVMAVKSKYPKPE